MNLLEVIWVYVIPFLVVLSVVVFVHEFGHFIVARLSGVKVDEFSIGFGKEIFGFNDKHGTRWKISLVPLGGFVKMFGDDNAASGGMSEDAKEFSEEEKKVAFWYQKPHKKIPIIAAGPLANYVFAILIFAVVYMSVGRTFLPARVGEVLKDSAASEAGIQKDDLILRINDEEISRFFDIQRIISVAHDETIEILVDRNGKKIKLEASPRKVVEKGENGKETQRILLGIRSVNKVEIQNEKMGPVEAFSEAIEESWDISTNTLKALKQMITGARSADDIGGPLRIAEMTGDLAKRQGGFVDFMLFVSLLSINLGLINLMPVPLLDGGHIVVFLIELITRRELGEKTNEIFQRIGMVLIMSLMIFATWNDIVHLFERMMS